MNIIKRIILWAAGIKDPKQLLPVEVQVDAFSRQHFNADGSLKAPYRDFEAAQRGSDRMAEKTGLPFNAYKCRLCDSYHIGKSR